MRSFSLLALLVVAVFPLVASASHPLEPLSAAEIERAVKVLSTYKEFPMGALFPMVALNEPAKAEVKGFKAGQPLPRREAFATVLDRAANRTFDAVVDLQKNKVLSFKAVPGAQPLLLVAETELLPKIVRADPRWQAAMRKRGITDFEKVWVDCWATGSFYPKKYKGTRLLRGLSYWKDGLSNFYGRPIEGVIALVDMNREKVVELIDTGVRPIPKVGQELDPASLGPQRKDIKPLKIVTPDGPSYEINGHEVRWQKWRFRFAMHPREGLILYQVAYEDQGRERPILYRASLSETVVPYGDPDPNWSWRSAFDEGEYGMGRLMSELSPKMDAPENAVFFDADFSDDFGKPYVLKNAMGLYERDGGYLWKHYDIYTGKNEARRARDLVLFSVAAIGNYDYVFSWIFKQDGSLEVDVGLTGIMLPKGVGNGTGHDKLGHHGHLVAKNVVAPHHQHFLNYRLDFDIEGESNSVAEMSTSAMPAGKANPMGNGIAMALTPLGDERKAARDMDQATSRKWLVLNPDPKLKSELGYPPAFALLPGENSIPYLSKDSAVRKRAGFINHHFWATRYRADETYAAGYYPNQSSADGKGPGLDKWAANGESLDAQDVVLWYTFGVTHVPRPEEWPVMAVTHAGFRLVPAGFFSKNPGLDVPRPE